MEKIYEDVFNDLKAKTKLNLMASSDKNFPKSEIEKDFKVKMTKDAVKADKGGATQALIGNFDNADKILMWKQGQKVVWEVDYKQLPNLEKILGDMDKSKDPKKDEEYAKKLGARSIAIAESNEEDEDDVEYLEFSNGEITVSMYKEDGKWHEDRVIAGEKPYGWGSKTYQSYLSPEDIAGWLRKDYGGSWTVSLKEDAKSQQKPKEKYVALSVETGDELQEFKAKDDKDARAQYDAWVQKIVDKDGEEMRVEYVLKAKSGDKERDVSESRGYAIPRRLPLFEDFKQVNEREYMN
jgi:hypothetical protein